MAVEKRRGCGYRKIGGLYLVSEPGGMPCDRLPIALTVCPTCSHGFKQSRGWTWVDVSTLVGGLHPGCEDQFPCPLCMATSDMGKAGLLWIGEKFYKTPDAFGKECDDMGISRRISCVLRGFKVGVTWVLLAHPKAITKCCANCNGLGYLQSVVHPEECETCAGSGKLHTAGIFKVWRPQRIEKILPESQRDGTEHQELEKAGITAVFVPDNDPDHRGSIWDTEDRDGDDECTA